MSAFARFVLRDNGLAIHIAPHHVTQVRETSEGCPAIYLSGKDTPLMVRATSRTHCAEFRRRRRESR